MKSVRTTVLKRKTATTRLASLTAGKARKASPKPEKATSVPTTLEEAKALYDALKARQDDEILQAERTRYAKKAGAFAELFAPEDGAERRRSFAHQIAHALAGEWGDPERLGEFGFYQLQFEIHAAESLLSTIWARRPNKDSGETDELYAVVNLLKGIRERARAMFVLAPRFKAAFDGDRDGRLEGGAS